jgi:hypothetical protein
VWFDNSIAVKIDAWEFESMCAGAIDDNQFRSRLRQLFGSTTIDTPLWSQLD